MACQNATHPEHQRELQWTMPPTGNNPGHLNKPTQMVLTQPTTPTRTKPRRNTCVTGVLSRGRWTLPRRLHRLRLDANHHHQRRTPHSWIGMDKLHPSDHLILLRLGMIPPDSILRRPIWLKGRRLRRHIWQAWDLGRASCTINLHHHRIPTMDSRLLITISQTATPALMFRRPMRATGDTHLNHLQTASSTLVTDHLR
jgi:hypothetical protein